MYGSSLRYFYSLQIELDKLFINDLLSVLIRTEKSGYPLLYGANQILKCNIRKKKANHKYQYLYEHISN